MRARTSARLMLACLLSGLCFSATAEVPHDVRGSVERDGALLRVTATATAAAPLATCWSTAVDFDRVAEFIPHMTSSRVVSAPGEPVLVRQLGKARAGVFSVPIDVTLHMTLQPPQRISFRRVAGNVRHMQGHWTFAGDDAHCIIVYTARIEPAFWVPPLLGQRVVRAQVEEQLRGLVAEVERRAAPGVQDQPGAADVRP